MATLELDLYVDATLPAPLWSQIEEGLRRLLVSGVLRPGASLPSVRDLSSALRVNPGTVSRAYQRLSAAGLVEVRRGDGTYVAAAPPAMAARERSRALREEAGRYARAAASLGSGCEEAVRELRAMWEELAPRRTKRNEKCG
jgi:GntR family transcriptional regulator